MSLVRAMLKLSVVATDAYGDYADTYGDDSVRGEPAWGTNRHCGRDKAANTQNVSAGT